MNPLYPATFAAGVLVGFEIFDRLNAWRERQAPCGHLGSDSRGGKEGEAMTLVLARRSKRLAVYAELSRIEESRT